MNEIIKINLNKKAEKEVIYREELKNFPDTVCAFFEKLPNDLKNKIFSEQSNNESLNIFQVDEKNLEDDIANFDVKTLEDFMISYLNDLFQIARFKDIFEELSEDNLKQEIIRLLDLLWGNRGKDDNVMLFNQEYYNNFFHNRGVITKKIKDLKLKIDDLNDSIKKTIKQKRLTENKKSELYSLNKKINLLQDELDEYDSQNNNTDLDRMYFRDVFSRQRKEKELTKTIAKICEYLDPTEFAGIVSEQFERTFNKEFNSSNGSVSQGFEIWYEDHKDDKSLKQPVEMKVNKRQEKLIQYFISLMESYKIGKADKKTDDEMINTIRQMEISLKILGSKLK